jgi:glycerol transport system ATP-binding protein
VHEVAEILDVTRELERKASNISADAKQKISLGRGLVRKDVVAILFDEPLTVIDPHMKWMLRRQLKKIHHQLKLTLIYVTHDQVEALTFADEVVVMTNGRVVQKGGPEALFLSPYHSFVGYFIGSPGMNLCPIALDSVFFVRVKLGHPFQARRIATRHQPSEAVKDAGTGRSAAA